MQNLASIPLIAWLPLFTIITERILTGLSAGCRAEARYLVVPVRSSGTGDLGEEGLAARVTRNGLIGVAAAWTSPPVTIGSPQLIRPPCRVVRQDHDRRTREWRTRSPASGH